MVDLARRNFFKAKKLTTAPAIRLPWVLNEATFIDGCTQCGDCLTSCPENIIQKGDGGFPEVNFLKGECTFCQACVENCQQPLFAERALAPEINAWDLDISIKGDCLAVNDVFCQISIVICGLCRQSKSFVSDLQFVNQYFFYYL